LLVKVQVNAAGFEHLYSAEKVNQRAAKPVNRPSHHNVEASALRILEHLIEAGTIIAALTARYASVAVLLDNFPATTLSDLAKLPDLIFDGLLVGRYPDVDCGPFPHDAPHCLCGAYRLHYTKIPWFLDSKKNRGAIGGKGSGRKLMHEGLPQQYPRA
jgi:hypothetical protein